MSASRLLGLFLFLVGVALLGATTIGFGAELIVAFLGLAFLVAYAATRSYPLLVPGAILSGLGTGIVAQAAGAPGALVVLGLGLGFLAIPVIDLVASEGRPGWWWPLIPGGILTIVGTAEFTPVREAGRYVVPAALIVVGVLLLLRRGGPTIQPEAASPPEEDTPQIVEPEPSETQRMGVG
jgi:hypothetical protein